MTLDENPPNIDEALMARRLEALRPPKLDDAETTRILAEILAASTELLGNPGRAAALREATADVDRNRQRARSDHSRRPHSPHKPPLPVATTPRQPGRTDVSPKQRSDRRPRPWRQRFSWARETAKRGEFAPSAVLLPATITILWMLPATLALAIVLVIVLGSATAYVCLFVFAMTRPTSSERRRILNQAAALLRNRRDKDEPVA